MQRAIAHFVREALSSLWRRRRSTALSIATIAVAVFVLGGVLLVSANLERAIDRWAMSSELSVYLADDVTPGDRAAVERVLLESGVVAAREFVSREDALARFRQDFPDLAPAIDEDDNPLPASLDVRLRADARADAVERLAARVAAAPGVADVRFDRQWLDRLARLVRIIHGVGLLVGAIVVLAAGLTVMSVVRLGLIARRDEIEIMQLVGAPLAYIRGPFVVEGIAQGGVGAGLALVLVWLAYLAVSSRIGELGAGVIDPRALTFLPAGVAVQLVAGGMLVGCVGGWVAARGAR